MNMSATPLFCGLLTFCLAIVIATAMTATTSDTIVIDMRDGLADSRIRCLQQLPDGRMAIATASSVDIFDGTNVVSIALDPSKAYPLPGYNNHQRSMTIDGEGHIWLRQQRLLSVFDVARQEQVFDVASLMRHSQLDEQTIVQWPTDSMPAGTRPDVVTAVCDSFGGLWEGTVDRGVRYICPSRRQFSMLSEDYPHKSLTAFCSPRASEVAARIAPQATNCTLDDRQDYLYIGTLQGLLIVDNRDSVVARLTSACGLSSNNIMAMVRDAQGAVWATSVRGITRIAVTGTDSFAITNYGRLDGLELDGLAFRPNQMFFEDNGEIVAGYAGGSVRFRPDEVAAVSRPIFFMPGSTPYYIKNNGKEMADRPLPWLATTLIALLVLAVVSLSVVLLWVKRHHSVRGVEKSSLVSDWGRAISACAPVVSAESAEAAARELSAADRDFLDKAHALILEHISEEDFSIQNLSQLMSMDRTLLYRRMQSLTGTAPSVYLKNLRIAEACRLLAVSGLTISEIAYKTGFSSAKYFSTVFKEATGKTPKEYRAASRDGSRIAEPTTSPD